MLRRIGNSPESRWSQYAESRSSIERLERIELVLKWWLLSTYPTPIHNKEIRVSPK